MVIYNFPKLKIVQFQHIFLWDKIARPHRKLFYPLETCFSAYRILHAGKIYSVKKIIKKCNLVKSEKLHFFYFFGYFGCVTFTGPYWPTVDQKAKTCF